MGNYVSKVQTPDGTAKNIKSYKTESIPMGKVASTSTSTVFTATIDGITELRNGVCVWLTNDVVTSAANFTININGLGAKPVYRSNAATTRETTRFDKAYTIFLIYNETRVSGGCWDYVYGFDSNTTYTNMSQTEASAGTATTGRVISAKVLSTTIEEHTAEINAVLPELVDNGAKNWLEVPDFVKTVNGITFTAFRGGIFATGTATADASIAIYPKESVTGIGVSDIDIMVSGCMDGSETTYRCFFQEKRSNTYVTRVTLTDTPTEYHMTNAFSNYRYLITIYSGCTVNNKLFEPMICTKAAWDISNWFLPYAKTNPELTICETQDRNAIIEAIDDGAKNLLNHTAYTRTVNKVTYTVNADRSIQISSAGDNTQSLLFLVQNYTLPAGRYVLSGCSGGSSTTYDLRIRVGGSAFYINYDGGTEFTYNGIDTFEASIVVRAGQTVNITMKPMICTKADWDVSQEYQQYRPSYQTLCDTNEYITGTGTELASNANLNDYNYTCKMYSPSAAISATISNTPWTTSGFQLITVQFITAASYIQFLLPNTTSGKWYRRRYASGTWSNWVEFDDASYLITGANAIANNTDLNNLKTPGVYTCASDTVANTLSHCPYKSSGFRCDIIQTSDTNFIRQIIQPNQMTTTGGNARYERSCVISSNTWSSWYKFEGTKIT